MGENDKHTLFLTMGKVVNPREGYFKLTDCLNHQKY